MMSEDDDFGDALFPPVPPATPAKVIVCPCTLVALFVLLISKR